MIIERLPVGIYLANCYLVACEKTKKAIVIDPGGDSDMIIDRIDALKLNVEYIVLTHGHGDHMAGLKDVKDKTNAKVLIHGLDKDLLMNNEKNLTNSMAMEPIELEPDILLEENDTIKIGNYEGVVIHTPGHTPGGICIKVEDNLFTGDTLFAGSVGRTDLYGGSHDDIMNSIKNKIAIYPDNTKVYPGHGPTSTIGTEKKINPFLK